MSQNNLTQKTQNYKDQKRKPQKEIYPDRCLTLLETPSLRYQQCHLRNDAIDTCDGIMA